MNPRLAKALQQLGETWKQLGLNQRVSLVLAAGAVLAGLVGLTLWSGRGDYALLYGKLDDAEAARVISALDEAKIPYRTSSGSILIPADKVHRTRMQLAGKGIPRSDGVGFEIFDKPNFGISDFVQRANYVRAVQGELARTISQLDEIESARVMIVMPENRLLIDLQKKPTASVFVRTKANGPLGAAAVNSIRFLVANAVEGLQASSVSVIDHLGNALAENTEPDSPIGQSNNQLTARRNLEQYLARKAESMLEKVLGPGQAVVRVAAELNWDVTTRVEEKFDPEGQVVRSATINDETTTSASGGAPPPSPPGSPNVQPAAGVAGAQSNTTGTTDTNAAAGPQNNSLTKKKVTNNQYEINKTTSNVSQSAGALRRLTAAVFIAQRSEGDGKDKKPVARSPDDLKKLQRIVQSALGVVEGDPARTDVITLEEIPFNEAPAMELTEKLEKDGKRALYVEMGKTGGFVLLALGILFVFFRTLKKTPANDLPMGLAPKDPVADAAKSSTDEKPAVVTVELLNQLIRENPANVTQAVRSWMSKENVSP